MSGGARGGYDEPRAATPARALTEQAAGPEQDTDRLNRAADELLRRGRAGLGMTETTPRYRQLELAQLLLAIARGLEAGAELPTDVLRHAANLARHILSYPGAVPAAAATDTAEPAAAAVAQPPPNPAAAGVQPAPRPAIFPVYAYRSGSNHDEVFAYRSGPPAAGGRAHRLQRPQQFHRVRRP